MNGIGLRLYGRRAPERETGGYVKTRFLSFVYVPLLALDAWRVIDADGGWYFLAKERLTGFDRKLNVSVLAGIVLLSTFGAWKQHYGSERYLAGQKLAQADEQRAAGHAGTAAELYAGLVASDSSQRREAAARFAALTDGLATTPLVEITAMASAAGAAKELAVRSCAASRPKPDRATGRCSASSLRNSRPRWPRRSSATSSRAARGAWPRGSTPCTTGRRSSAAGSSS